MGHLLAISLPGALAAVLIAVTGFVVVLGVCFVVLRIISFVVSGTEEEEAAAAAAREDVEEQPPE